MPLSDRIDLDQVPPSFRPFAEAILRRDDPAPGLIRLLGTLGEKAPDGEARDFALLLRRTLAQSARLDRVSEVYIRDKYPLWYIRAINDRHRNTAYRQALQALVTPDTLVVEAGAGSGLFAMLAARAGASHVYACENDPHVAAIARANIENNGLTGRITLYECRYQDLRVGEHLPRRADLLLHEFVNPQFLVPRMASMFKRFRAELLTPAARILPHRFATTGMLVGDEWLLDSIRVPALVEGLDVSGINLFASAGITLAGPVPIEQPLSAARTLAEFDLLSEEDPSHGSRTVEFEATADGYAVGILQWVRHDFPDGSTYENRPELACNWWPAFWPFPHPVPLAVGDTLAVRVENTDTELFIDLDAPSDG
ncbi:MAG: 50S ribosomal protein L11 methyltransferase [Proteobacteria bacterium]|nr:50S ribosomal protein L11 methyltransferase [Pseudomonadota bacterium]